ncbi:MAG: NGG1p interacting factor NIF3 [Nitrospirota bacterium]|nr:NGG1p interacting factor NIF3 [Nitrospirota bacterium]
MKLKDIYKKAVAVGINSDPRGRDAVSKVLQRAEKEYSGLKPDEKDLFDLESLENPYADTRILNGSGEEEINSILVGIDCEAGEVLLVESLRNRGEAVDLIMSHHPEGMAYANLYSVMHMQADILNRFGVPINIAEDLMETRINEVQRKIMPFNHARAVDAAKLLGFPFICIHTPADNMVAAFLQKLLDDTKPDTLSDLTGLLREIPEYRSAAKNGSGPRIILGSKTRKAGKVFVDMTGGTEGSKDIFGSLTSAGVNTIVAMHLGEESRKEAEKNHLNVVIAGHISSDNLGLNLLFDEIFPDEAGSPVKILECSGFNRIMRSSKV